MRDPEEALARSSLKNLWFQNRYFSEWFVRSMFSPTEESTMNPADTRLALALLFSRFVVRSALRGAKSHARSAVTEERAS